MITVQEFVNKHRITMSVTYADDNPNWCEAHTPYHDYMDHWKIVLRCGRKRLTTYFSMGSGHKGKEPEIADVFDCLASDADTIESTVDFEEWSAELGYDTDSRKAERAYNVVKRETLKLERFLGHDLYQALLWDTERL